ncbi:fatty acid-binding protein 2-like isoform X2 [Nymphalis io]|uniref:fatty acid-binding protein 2-like isoform X2 n=1 Tax=Inachis io TaxID=171585 RepID=UPI002166C519|nr:fatty acid-binding protein 2-like isoform X2 [Nymphalis io]
MAYIGKTYKFQKDENFREFLAHLGVPADKVEYLLTSKPSQKLEKDGDNYTLTTIDASTKEMKFKEGVEFDESITPEITSKTTFTVSGDVVTQVQKLQDGRSITLKRKYSSDQLVVEITTSGWDGVARRYYAAV